VTLICRVPTHPGKFWKLNIAFSRPGKSWNSALVMESHENLTTSHGIFLYTYWGVGACR